MRGGETAVFVRRQRILEINGWCRRGLGGWMENGRLFSVSVLWMRDGGGNGRLFPVFVLWMGEGGENGRLFSVSVLWMRDGGENGRLSLGH